MSGTDSNQPFWTLNRILLALAGLTLVGLWAAGVFSRGATPVQSAAPAAAPVEVGAAVRKTVPLELRAIATAEPYSTVGVKAQVAGEITGVHFREGDDVRQGALLFTIDQRPFQAELRAAEAALARDQAQLKNAQAQADRYARLMEEGVVAREQYDQVRTNFEALEAAVRAGRAAVENARLRLAYTTIHAPLGGRTGRLMLHQGNVAKANPDDPLVVINQVQPIYVNFAVPENYLPVIKRYMSQGKLRVEALLSGEPQPEIGTLTFVDNAVDVATGTIRLKATFDNQQRRLWPGQFINVALRLAEQRDAVVVPSQAVQTGQDGQYVFVIKDGKTAEFRPVVVARTQGQETILEKGVEPGEVVVTDGHLRLTPGAPVEIKNAGNTAGNGS